MNKSIIINNNVGDLGNNANNNNLNHELSTKQKQYGYVALPLASTVMHSGSKINPEIGKIYSKDVPLDSEYRSRPFRFAKELIDLHKVCDFSSSRIFLVEILDKVYTHKMRSFSQECAKFKILKAVEIEDIFLYITKKTGKIESDFEKEDNIYSLDLRLKLLLAATYRHKYLDILTKIAENSPTSTGGEMNRLLFILNNYHKCYIISSNNRKVRKYNGFRK